MTESLTLTTERVDDMPLLLAQLERMGVQALLEALSDETHWSACEGALNQHARRVYALQPACVRLESTTASGYGTVTEDGLFQFGPSKDHRPDLPQVKVMISALDPLGMPVA